MQPQVSIIVPIYNAGQYLEKTLYSLVNQTLQNIEIILVLDCPTDGSDLVAESFAAKDNRIKLIRNEQNIYVGPSRNRGIEAATGEYIGFCDHDDYCDPQMYELLYRKAASENLDLVRCNLCKEKGGENILYNYPYPLLADDEKQTIGYIIADMQGKFMWNYIYKSVFIRKNQIRFFNGKILGEDYLFLVQSVFFAKRASEVNDCLYFHLYHAGNAYTGQSYASVQNIILLNEELFRFLNSHSLFVKNRDAVVWDMTRHLYTAFRRNLRVLALKENLKELSKIKGSAIMTSNINYVFLSKNLFYFLEKKPMTILFLVFVKFFCARNPKLKIEKL